MNSSIVTIHIKNLRLRTFIGFNEDEKIKKQDVVINAEISYDGAKPVQSDSVNDAYNYKILTKKIIRLVEENHFNLLERMTADILKLVCESGEIINARVEVDKPHALRFSDSVSISMSYP